MLIAPMQEVSELQDKLEEPLIAVFNNSWILPLSHADVCLMLLDAEMQWMSLLTSGFNEGFM